MYYVYQLRRVDRELPFYVGKGKGRRAWEHFAPSSLTGRSRKENTIRKANLEGVEIAVEMLEAGLTEPDAFCLERLYIALYGRLNTQTGCLTNLTDGGEGGTGYVKSEKERMRLAEFTKGRERSAEHCAKLSRAKKGRAAHPAVKAAAKRTHAGVAKSEDHKRKIGAANKGKIRTTDERSKMSEANARRPLLKCPHCPMVTKPAALKRYHGENCKFK